MKPNQLREVVAIAEHGSILSMDPPGKVAVAGQDGDGDTPAASACSMRGSSGPELPMQVAQP